MKMTEKEKTGSLAGYFVTAGIGVDYFIENANSLAFKAAMYVDQYTDKYIPEDPTLNFVMWAGAYALLITSPITIGYLVGRYGERAREIVHAAGEKAKGLLKK